MFLFRKAFWLTILKVWLLLFVTGMILVLMPELRYDFGPRTPIQIHSLQELRELQPSGSTFVVLHGHGATFGPGEPPSSPAGEAASAPATGPGSSLDDALAFTHNTHGVRLAYFLIDRFGPHVVVRTGEPVTDEWRKLDRWAGRLRPYRRMPFRGTIRTIFRENFGVEVPADAYALLRDDIPKPDPWTLGAEIFVVVVWIVLFYLFVIHPIRKRGKSVLRRAPA